MAIESLGVKMIKVGQKVKILRKDIHHLKHRKIKTGKITEVDGYLLLVKPSWCDWEIELYPNEVEVVK